MTKDEIQKLAKNCMFSFYDDEIEYVNKSFDILKQQIELLNQIDTSTTTEMVYPFEESVSYLRVDDSTYELSLEDVLKNAGQKEGNFIKVATKVVK